MDVAWIDKNIPAGTINIKNKLQNIISMLDGSNLSIRRILNELRPTILDRHGLIDAIKLLEKQFTDNTGIPVLAKINEPEIKLPETISTCIFRAYQEAFTNISRYAEATSVRTSLRIMKSIITIKISDNGKGFNTTYVESKKSFGLLGMKERVHSLGGTFKVESSPGKGTTIIIRLSTAIPKKQLNAAFTMKRILLADDHSFIRLGIIQILKDEYPSVEIREVSDGDSLIKEVIKEDWDLVISDLDMPGRNGLEALEQIKLIKPSLPVLIISIFTEDVYGVRVLKAGAAGYMNKNAAPFELIKAIQRIKLGRKYITAEIAEKLLTNVDTDKKPHEILTNREFEIFTMLASGKSLTYIASTLSLALTTVSTHRTRLLKKLNVSNNYELARYAMAHHIISDLKNK